MSDDHRALYQNIQINNMNTGSCYLTPRKKNTKRKAPAALALGVCPNTIRRWAKHGRLPFQLTGGGARRFDVSAFKPGEFNNCNQANLRVHKKASEESGVV